MDEPQTPDDTGPLTLEEGFWNFRAHRQNDIVTATAKGDVATVITLKRRTLRAHVAALPYIDKLVLEDGNVREDDLLEILSILNTDDDSVTPEEVDAALRAYPTTLLMISGILEYCVLLSTTYLGCSQHELAAAWARLAHTWLPDIIALAEQRSFTLRPHSDHSFDQLLATAALNIDVASFVGAQESPQEVLDRSLEGQRYGASIAANEIYAYLDAMWQSLEGLRTIPLSAPEKFDAIIERLTVTTGVPGATETLAAFRAMVIAWKRGDFMGARSALLESDAARAVDGSDGTQAIRTALASFLANGAYLAMRSQNTSTAVHDAARALVAVAGEVATPALSPASLYVCLGLGAKDSNQLVIATFFLKLAVRTAELLFGTHEQALRLPQLGEMIEETLDNLAFSLIVQGRLAEAFEIIDLMQRRSPGTSTLTFIQSEKAAAAGVFGSLTQHFPDEPSRILGIATALTEAIDLLGADTWLNQPQRRPSVLAIPGELATLDGEPTACLTYSLQGEELNALVTIGNESHTVKLNIYPELLYAVIADVFTAIANLNRDPRKLLQDCYRRLIEPLEPQLRHIKRIVIAAPGVLHGLPWGALHDGERYIVERWSFVRWTGTNSEWRSPRRPIHVLTCASTDGTEARYAALSDALVNEAAALESIATSRKLLNADFTMTRLREALPEATVLHVASHFQFDRERLEDSFLLLGDGVELTLRELLQFPLAHLDLVALASCHSSSVGNFASPDGIRAVDTLLLNAGVAATIGTLWSVDDVATHTLMREFYAHLAVGRGKDGALAAAQRSMASGIAGEGRWRLPYFWATVVLSGNWLGYDVAVAN